MCFCCQQDCAAIGPASVKAPRLGSQLIRNSPNPTLWVQAHLLLLLQLPLSAYRPHHPLGHYSRARYHLGAVSRVWYLACTCVPGNLGYEGILCTVPLMASLTAHGASPGPVSVAPDLVAAISTVLLSLDRFCCPLVPWVGPLTCFPRPPLAQVPLFPPLVLLTTFPHRPDVCQSSPCANLDVCTSSVGGSLLGVGQTFAITLVCAALTSACFDLITDKPGHSLRPRPIVPQCRRLRSDPRCPRSPWWLHL